MKVSYKMVKKADRLFFNDGEKYVLLDSGFGKGSVSANGMIGPFKVKTISEAFISSFINFFMEDGKSVSAIFNPMDGYNCLLKGNELTISDEEMDGEEGKYFLPFVHSTFPIVEGCIHGEKCRFLFDSGARMTMFGEKNFAKEKVRSYKEWMAMKQTYADLDVYKLKLSFPNGLEYEGEGALVLDPMYQMAAKMMNIRAMLGIDIFNSFDMLISAKGAKRGITLIERKN